jgi:urease accessory protein
MASGLHETALSKRIVPVTVLQPIQSESRPSHTRLERVSGRARIAVRAERGPADGTFGRTRLEVLYQQGAAKIRLPRVPAGDPLEAVLLNTAGGVTGGDRLAFEVTAGEGARAVATTQAAERVYRRTSGVAEIETTLSVAAGGRLDWLPQETILFDKSGLARRLTADVAPDAILLAIESLVLGRAAMGERVRQVFATDAWRIRRGGRLVFADTVRLDGDAHTRMAGGATGGGAAAFATVVLVAPMAERMLDLARAALAVTSVEGGVSAWNGLLVARMIAAGGQALRAGLIPLVEALRGAPMPRVWYC